MDVSAQAIRPFQWTFRGFRPTWYMDVLAHGHFAPSPWKYWILLEIYQHYTIIFILILWHAVKISYLTILTAT